MANEKRPLTPDGATFDPYRAPETSASLEQVDELGRIPAERGTRLAARLVDGVIYVVVGGLVAGGFMTSTSEGGLSALGLAAGVAGAFGAFALLVLNVLWLKEYGQTAGKRLLGIAIVRSDGTQATLGRLLGLRWFVMTLISYIPGVGTLISLLNPLLIFREDRKCLHDHIADTIVVRAPR